MNKDLEYKQKDIICTFCYKIKDRLTYTDFYNLRHIISQHRSNGILQLFETRDRFIDFLFLLSKKYDIDVIQPREKALLRINVIENMEYMAKQIRGWIVKKGI
jgi:hypothetical protein